MREIKFRTWKKFGTQEMFRDIQAIDFKKGFVFIGYKVSELTIRTDKEKLENVELMQYTGLKDKNGVEIYEGDVVIDQWANEYTPVFQNGIYMAYNPKHLMESEPSTQFNIIWKNGCEVIGNIYENPELLSTKKD